MTQDARRVASAARMHAKPRSGTCCTRLSLLHQSGQGVDQDDARALDLFRRVLATRNGTPA
ncbi:MAG: hypothetical protein R3B82_14895 [Sandaracinaceae bacterium]